ncbi:MAG: Mrp/NBP35 family ATP-binding protein [Anaerolineae bacterium]
MSSSEQRKQSGQQATAQAEAGSAEHLNNIRRVIAVMSGKGGVGKSFVTGIMAAELRRQGFRVGILDADITGPSIPKIFGTTDRPLSGPVGILPVRSRTGVDIISINLMLENEDDPVVWRGPLIARAIRQFWGDVFWRDLDYMLVDLPPGTSDAPLTVMQSLPLDGIVLVTSPQDLAGMVVRKAAHMAGQLHVPILGVVENMSYVTCPRCGEPFELFGPSHISAICEPQGIPVLARLPLDPAMSALCDLGEIEACASALWAPLVESLLDALPPEKVKPHHGPAQEAQPVS